jgi:hypothetical protein
MKTINFIIITVFCILINTTFLFAQQNTQACKITSENYIGDYIGDCKNGVANGKGEIKGSTHYIGMFKNGMPNGNGICYYGDSSYYDGNFQDGIKEGKGEMHYLRKGIADSIIKGYWSGDIYRGKNYLTYVFTSSSLIDFYEIIPSGKSGSSVTFTIATVSSSPNGTSDPVAAGDPVYITSLLSYDGDVIRRISANNTAYKVIVTYELKKFPVQLYGTLSNGQNFNLDLYKSADWRVSFNYNK